ncbi:MAG: bifunctional UDP-N-acetylglucosamine diphosphorylase/glucosamine-1-phosphate N-acetyltransferase GlmU [Deltaproteobacteria bacterium]|nr:bifunctional UDP-N-acetylglucosamine diphosphorylase/glucosamine-1-phosphate N-acetyltransferase GlmU [Deltaproteobacteria bacterium]
MKNIAAIVLAAGKGTRMKSNIPKVLHRVAGKPMLFYPLSLLSGLKPGKVVVVVGHGAQDVKAAFKSNKISYALQKEQLGTGHAVLIASKALAGFKGDVLILSGDVPLISKDTINAFLKMHRGNGRKKPVVSLITTILEDPRGYGRVVRDSSGAVTRIVEDKDCSVLQKRINEVNSGIYLIKSDFLKENIKKLGKENAQGEYYLPDLIQMATSQGHRVVGLTHMEPDEVMGINNRIELARANALMRRRISDAHMLGGITIIDPDTTYIDHGVTIGVDTTIYPGVHLRGDTGIGANCIIEEGVRIEASRIGDNSIVKSHTLIESTVAGNDVQIGPFARLRPGNDIKDKVRIGNFVEVKKTVIGKGSKANHLAYLGDSVIGDDVNIGAGTITCNYDGVNKYQTTIEDGAFIGSDSQLVAPVRVGKGAYVGSGSTVTKDVPPDALVITRARERVIEGWAKKKRSKKSQGH